MFDAWLHYWPYIVAVVSAVVGFAAAVHAAMTKDDVHAAIGWVAVIILSPLLGASIYLVAGINRIRRTSVGHRRARSEDWSDPAQASDDNALPPVFSSDPAFQAMKRLGDNVSPFPLIGGNEIEPLFGGDQAYPAMVQAIAAARHYVVVSTYIFDNDSVGRRFADALIKAKERGVEVRVLIDAVGARYSRPSILHRLHEGGVAVDLFLGNIIGFRLPYANLRNHRKILIVDGMVAFTGGMNIRTGFVSNGMPGDYLRDTHFALRGPAVGQLLAVFADDWHFTTGEKLAGQPWNRAAGPAPAGAAAAARVIVSGPDLRLAATHTVIMGAIAAARQRIRINSPYFLPDRQLVGALAVAARRGVTVDIVIPAASNLRLVDHAVTSQLDQVIAAGCRVWRPAGSFDHSKLMAVDDAWTLVGSSNIDPRSFRLNFELDLEIFDTDLVQTISGYIEAQISGARRETLESLHAQPLWKRLRNRIVWLASPVL